jgi:hypothetical protein
VFKNTEEYEDKDEIIFDNFRSNIILWFMYIFIQLLYIDLLFKLYIYIVGCFNTLFY